MREQIFDEFEQVGLGLERHHGLFNEFWAMGEPRFTDKIPTAAVAFNKKGQFIEFLFNEKFWRSIDNYEREFVISHEISHCLLKHGQRGVNCDQPQIANVAMDIVVNHGLVDNFKFDKGRIPNLEKIGIIWKDRVFGKKSSQIEDKREFEYYFSKIKKECPLIKINTLDVHGFGGDALPEGSIEIPGHILDEIKDKIEDALSEEEFNHGIKAGVISGTAKKKVQRQEKRVLQRWEKIIKRWTCKEEIDDEVWIRESRRMKFMPSNFMLPYDGPYEKPGGKVDVWFFQDTSGSCEKFANHFFNAARTFPTNFFNIQAFCFDTRIFPVDYKNPTLKGFGGTAFDIIENYIQKHAKKYPDAIFVFTDGYGNNVKPKFSDRWYVFLEGDGATSKECFPKECNFYNLSDFIK